MFALFAQVAILAFTGEARASTFNTSDCPNLRSTACLSAIRSAIDAVDYAAARDMAEAQCDAAAETSPSNRLTEHVLAEQALGCYYLFVLERFLGRSLRAMEARDRSRRIAVFGCEHGFMPLCEVLLGFVDRQMDDLLGEVRIALESKSKDRDQLRGAPLRAFTGARELPRGFVDKTRARLLQVYALAGQKLETCDGCKGTVMDGEVALDGGDVVLKLKLYDQVAQRVVYEKAWRTSELDERRRLFGLDTEVPALMVATRRIDLWHPDYGIQAGMGAVTIPNSSGHRDNAQRLVIEARAGERLGQRRWETGMLLSVHMTRASLFSKYGRESDLEEEEEEETDEALTPEEQKIADAKKKALAPYDAAYATYLYVGRHLFGNRDSYQGVRQGVTLAVGGVLASNFLAGTARLGYDVHVGRRLVLTPAAYWIGPSSMALSSDVKVSTKPAKGGGLIISYDF